MKHLIIDRRAKGPRHMEELGYAFIGLTLPLEKVDTASEVLDDPWMLAKTATWYELPGMELPERGDRVLLVMFVKRPKWPRFRRALKRALLANKWLRLWKGQARAADSWRGGLHQCGWWPDEFKTQTRNLCHHRRCVVAGVLEL